jgi:hypothetical protein
MNRMGISLRAHSGDTDSFWCQVCVFRRVKHAPFSNVLLGMKDCVGPVARLRRCSGCYFTLFPAAVARLFGVAGVAFRLWRLLLDSWRGACGTERHRSASSAGHFGR